MFYSDRPNEFISSNYETIAFWVGWLNLLQKTLYTFNCSMC